MESKRDVLGWMIGADDRFCGFFHSDMRERLWDRAYEAEHVEGNYDDPSWHQCSDEDVDRLWDALMRSRVLEDCATGKLKHFAKLMTETEAKFLDEPAKCDYCHNPKALYLIEGQKMCSSEKCMTYIDLFGIPNAHDCFHETHYHLQTVCEDYLNPDEITNPLDRELWWDGMAISEDYMEIMYDNSEQGMIYHLAKATRLLRDLLEYCKRHEIKTRPDDLIVFNHQIETNDEVVVREIGKVVEWVNPEETKSTIARKYSFIRGYEIIDHPVVEMDSSDFKGLPLIDEQPILGDEKVLKATRALMKKKEVPEE